MSVRGMVVMMRRLWPDLLRDPEKPGHHHGRDAFARYDDQIHGLDPDRERQLRGVQRRLRRDKYISPSSSP
jgi:hypothetical protein